MSNRIEILTSRFLSLRDRLHRTAMAMLHDAMDADDAVQEAYARLSSSGLSMESGADAQKLLYRAVRNNCVDTLRMRSRQSDEPIEERAEEDTLDETGTVMSLMLKELPPLQRRVFEMATFDEMEYKEIADALGMTNEAVRQNMARARQRVRQIYRQLNK